MQVEVGTTSLDWDKKLIEFRGHFLQSNAWGEFQQQYGRQPVYFSDTTWMGLGVIISTKGIKYLNFSYGPTLSSDANWSEITKHLSNFCKNQKIDFIRLEPQLANESPLPKELIRVAENQPELTNILDISPSPEELLTKISSGHRYDIRHADSRKLTVTFSQDEQDIDLFLEMHHETITRAKIKSFPDQYYRDLVKIFFQNNHAYLAIAKADNKPIASAIIFTFDDTAYYAFASAFQEANRKLHAAVYLIWEVILKSKAEGKTKFDFWGVAPENQPDHRWAGLSYFKRAFGGTDLVYLGTFELPINKLKYFGYNQLKRLRYKIS